MSIKVKVGGSRSIRATPKQDTTRSIVTQGQAKPVIEPDSVVLGIDTIGPYVRDIDAGPGIVITPELDTESANVIIRHANTSTAVSTTNDPLDFVRNIGIDSFGHAINFENTTFWNYHFFDDNGVIKVKDFTIGNTSFSVNESTNNLQGLNSIQVGELTFTQGRITGTDDIQISPTFDGVVDVNNHRIANILDPLDASDAVPRRYLDQTIDDLTISFRVLDDPVEPTDPANKRYVDSIPNDLLEKQVVKAATTDDLNGIYENAPFDIVANTIVASTITLDPVLVLNIDGVENWDLGDGILVFNQTNPEENGRYEIITIGDNINEWVLQRGPYSDETQEIAGYPIFVRGGNEYGQTGWVSTVDDAETFTLGTDPITYKQFQGSGIDGRGLTLTNGTVFDVDLDQTLETIRGISGVTTFSSNGAITIPVGTTAQRPSIDTQGMIRFNVNDSQFEGYDGTAWKGLGGVIDVDQDTFITAESTPGTDNDQLDFFTSGQRRMRIGSSGSVNIDTNLNLANLSQNRVVFVGTGGQLIDSNTFMYDGSTLTVKGDADITGNLTIGGNIIIGDEETDSITVTADFESNLLPNISNTFDLGTIGKNWNRLFVSSIKSDTEVVSIDNVGALKIPTGAQEDRPAEQTGLIRFNTTAQRFEGYDGVQWAGLAGSVIDVDRNTFIIAETSPAADNNQLDFFTANTHRLRIDSDGTFRFGSDNLSKVVINYTTGELNVNGQIAVSEKIIATNGDLVLEPEANTSGTISVSDTRITNVALPTANGDAVNLDYLENGSFARTLAVADANSSFTIDLLENDPSINALYPIKVGVANNELTLDLYSTAVTPGRYGNDGFTPRFTVDSDGRIVDAIEVPFQLQSNAILEFEEASQDITAAQFIFATHSGISFTYEDERGTGNLSTEGLISATIDDFDINITGDMVGSNTVVSVSDVTIPVSINVNYVEDVDADADGSIQVTHTPAIGSTAVIKHGNTSSINDTNFTLPNVPLNLTFDEFGHTQSVTSVDLDTRYVPTTGGTFTGNITSNGDMIANRFVDRNNQSFYVDPFGTSRVVSFHFGYNQSFTQLFFNDGEGGAATFYGTGGNLGFLNNTFNYVAYSDRSASNWVVPGGDVQAQRFVDTNDTSYFVNPHGDDSKLGALNVDNFIDINSGTLIANTTGIYSTTIFNLVAADHVSITSGNGLIDTNTARIVNVVNPINDQDAATKNYVDTEIINAGVQPGNGLSLDEEDFELDVNVDDSTIEIEFSTNALQVKDSGITNAKIQNPFINLAAENGTTDRLNLGELITFASGEGVNTTVSNNQILIAGELANNTNIGIASFIADNFTVTAGSVAVTRINGGTF